MDLITLIGLFAAIAVVLTFIGKFLFSQTNIPINFLRYLVGVWFIFSGAVKAIDPSGTAIKMEEYFEIFENDRNKNFKKESLISIIFGVRTSDIEIDIMKYLCKKYSFSHIQFKKAQFKKGKFETEIIDI